MEESISSEISDAVEIIKKSWKFFGAHLGIFIPIGITFAVLNFISELAAAHVPDKIKGIIFFITLIISNWLMMVMLKTIMNLTEGKKNNRITLINDLKGKFVSFMAVTLLVSVLTIGGFLCLFIPGFYLLTIFYFSDIFVLLGETSPVNALKQSMQLVKGILRRVFFCVILVICLVIIPMLSVQILSDRQPVLSRILIMLFLIILIPYSNLAKVMIFREINVIKKDNMDE